MDEKIPKITKEPWKDPLKSPKLKKKDFAKTDSEEREQKESFLSETSEDMNSTPEWKKQEKNYRPTKRNSSPT